ncbi:MAG: hypothetical protein AAFX86_01625 [Pseudomonadota bacterium]
MPLTLQPMDARDAESLAWSWAYVGRGLEGLIALLGWAGCVPTHLLRGAWRAANARMRYLEAMARRLLVAEAGKLSPEARPACVPKGPSPARPDRARGARGFRLIDTAAPAHFPDWFDDGAPTEAALPATVFGAAGGDPTPVVPAHALAARIGALKSLIEAPDTAARRMARHLAEGARAVLCLTRRPVARTGPMDLERSAFFESERLAFTVLNRAAPVATGPPG